MDSRYDSCLWIIIKYSEMVRKLIPQIILITLLCEPKTGNREISSWNLLWVLLVFFQFSRLYGWQKLATTIVYLEHKCCKEIHCSNAWYFFHFILAIAATGDHHEIIYTGNNSHAFHAMCKIIWLSRDDYTYFYWSKLLFYRSVRCGYLESSA